MENNDLRLNSYLTKDELINMLSNLHFEYVRNINMNLITGCLIETDPDNPKKQEIKPLYYTIDIC